MSPLKDSMENGTKDFEFCDLIRNDWKDMLSAFYFPRITKMIKDERILKWIESVNTELGEDGQDV